MKKLIIFILKAVGGILAFALFYLLIDFCLSSITVEAEDAPDEMAIYILTNGVHTDIVVPTKNELIDWSKEIKFEHVASADSSMQWLAMGWGDKGFYLETPTWAELKPSVAFRAALGLSTTAIHATYYQEMQEGADCKKILISKEQYQRLIDFIQASFQKDSAGHFIKVETDANYGDTDAFYEANGSYSMLGTCNSWSNRALKAAGQRACLWTAFDSGIFSKYE